MSDSLSFFSISANPSGNCNLPLLKTSTVAPSAPTFIASSRCSIPFLTRPAAPRTTVATLHLPTVSGPASIGRSSGGLPSRRSPARVSVCPPCEPRINPSRFSFFRMVRTLPSPIPSFSASRLRPILRYLCKSSRVRRTWTSPNFGRGPLSLAAIVSKKKSASGLKDHAFSLVLLQFPSFPRGPPKPCLARI